MLTINVNINVWLARGNLFRSAGSHDRWSKHNLPKSGEANGAQQVK